MSLIADIKQHIDGVPISAWQWLLVAIGPSGDYPLHLLDE